MAVGDWKIEFAATHASASTWYAWSEFAGQLESFNFKRQIADWHLGPRAATGTIVLSNEGTTDSALAIALVGSKVRITATVPSGDVVIFTGLVLSRENVLSAASYARIRLTITDWFGYEAQQLIVTAGITSSTAGILSTWLAAASEGALDSRFPTVTGVNQTIPAGTYNLPTTLSTIARGDLGALFVTAAGEWMYWDGAWWVNGLPHDVITAIGSDQGTPARGYTYRFPMHSSSYGVGVTEMVNYLVWTSPAPSSPHTFGDTNSVYRYGIRGRSDTLYVNTDALITSQAAVLLTATKDPTDRFHSITYPADMSTHAMEYSAIAEITDKIAVNVESREDDWYRWVEAFVISVQHSWTPHSGWTVTLATTRAGTDEEACECDCE